VYYNNNDKIITQTFQPLSGHLQCEYKQNNTVRYIKNFLKSHYGKWNVGNTHCEIFDKICIYKLRLVSLTSGY